MFDSKLYYWYPGDSSAKGELFGLHNLLQFESSSILLKLREKYAPRAAGAASSQVGVQTAETKSDSSSASSGRSSSNSPISQFNNLKTIKVDDMTDVISAVLSSGNVIPYIS